MPLRSFAKFVLVMSRRRKELRGTLGLRIGHGLCVNWSPHVLHGCTKFKPLCDICEEDNPALL